MGEGHLQHCRVPEGRVTLSGEGGVDMCCVVVEKLGCYGIEGGGLEFGADAWG